MTKREKQLMLIAGTLAFLVLVPLLYSLYGGSSSKVFAQRNLLRKEVAELQQAVRNKEANQKKLEVYMDQSLPLLGNWATTRDRYQIRLGNLMRDNGFQDSNVTVNRATSQTPTTRSNRNGFQTFSYRLRGTASLEALTNLLREFYAAEFLHIIKSLSITPVEQSNRMTISMEVEAIALDNAKRQTNIAWNPSEDTDFQQLLGDYVRQVNDRALFSVYRPPTPPTPPPTPPPPPPEYVFTEAMHTIVGFIGDVNGVYEVHLDRQLKGDKLRLKVGDRFTVDGIECVIREIRFDRITIGAIDDESDPPQEDRFSIRMGKSINDFEESI